MNVSVWVRCVRTDAGNHAPSEGAPAEAGQPARSEWTRAAGGSITSSINAPLKRLVNLVLALASVVWLFATMAVIGIVKMRRK